MKCFALLVCLVLAVNQGLVAAEPNANEVKEIPLGKIWAFDMPGTRDVREIESTQQPGTAWEMKQSPLTFQIIRSLHHRPAGKAGAAFIVEGRGKSALKQADAILRKESERKTKFKSDTKLTLVFYSYVHGRNVQIESVDQSQKEIIVKYRFVSHETPIATTHFALIPISQPSAGTIQVTIDEISQDGAPLDPETIVCNSFSFRIE